MPDAWTEDEIREIVTDYFSMLRAELLGEEYNKSEHRRRLSPKLQGRSESSIEKKHQNISAVMIELGMPYIDGYKPLANYQRSIFPEQIAMMLQYNEQLIRLIAADAEMTPEPPEIADILGILDTPPENKGTGKFAASSNPPQYRSKTDYLSREASNSALGAAGELLVMKYEKARLRQMGQENLADRVERVSQTVGDQAGFDILSFDAGGRDRYLEVKTTKYGKETPFYISDNEKRFASVHSDRYSLYRLFRFRSNPGLYTLDGALDTNFRLVPTVFRADLI